MKEESAQRMSVSYTHLKVGVVKELNDEMKKKISSILGKEYVSIKVAEHSLFKNPGTSIYVKTKLSSRYSEANACLLYTSRCV